MTGAVERVEIWDKSKFDSYMTSVNSQRESIAENLSCKSCVACIIIIPYFLQSACHFLAVKPGGHYVDCTLGGGDMQLNYPPGWISFRSRSRSRSLASLPDLAGLTKVQSNFIHLAEIVSAHHWQPVLGILLDLGVSEHQINTPDRGFFKSQAR